jgi:hypothetical protein
MTRGSVRERLEKHQLGDSFAPERDVDARRQFVPAFIHGGIGAVFKSHAVSRVRGDATSRKRCVRCQEPFLEPGVRNRFLTERAGLAGLLAWGRPKRAADGGLVYHVLNRANARMTIFEDDEDYAAFEQVLEPAVERTQRRLLAYGLLPDH